MSEHTKGPWSVEAPMDHELTIVEAGKEVYDWRFIAICCYPDPDEVNPLSRKEVEANARLIAEAPRMFDVLEASAADPNDMTNWSDEQIRGWAYATARNARRAIAKARGQQ